MIVPVYNCAEFVKKCLDSISAQTFKNFEVIVVDDGSSDNSQEICKYYSGRDPRFKFFHRNNSGVSNTRNFGISQAFGTYITFVDSDDCIDESFLDLMYNTAVTHHCDIAACSFCLHEPNVRDEVYSLSDSVTFPDKQTSVAALAGEHVMYNSVWNKLYKRSLIVDNNVTFPPGVPVGEDNIFNLQAFFYSEKACFIPDVLYHYNVHSSSAMQNKNNEENQLLFITTSCLALRGLGIYEKHYDIIVNRLYNISPKNFSLNSKELGISSDINSEKLSARSHKVYTLVRSGLYAVYREWLVFKKRLIIFIQKRILRSDKV